MSSHIPLIASILLIPPETVQEENIPPKLRIKWLKVDDLSYRTKVMEGLPQLPVNTQVASIPGFIDDLTEALNGLLTKAA